MYAFSEWADFKKWCLWNIVEYKAFWIIQEVTFSLFKLAQIWLKTFIKNIYEMISMWCFLFINSRFLVWSCSVYGGKRSSSTVEMTFHGVAFSACNFYISEKIISFYWELLWFNFSEFCFSSCYIYWVGDFHTSTSGLKHRQWELRNIVKTLFHLPRVTWTKTEGLGLKTLL